MRFTTCTSVRHAVLAVNVDIVRRQDLHLIDRKAIPVAGKDRGMLVQAASDAFGLETTLAQDVSFSERIRAQEAGKRVGTIRRKGAWLEIGPIITVLLRSRALVIDIVRRWE